MLTDLTSVAYLLQTLRLYDNITVLPPSLWTKVICHMIAAFIALDYQPLRGCEGHNAVSHYSLLLMIWINYSSTKAAFNSWECGCHLTAEARLH